MNTVPLVDYYEVLGIRENTSLKEVKKSFREKAKKIHPDTEGGKESSDEEIKLLLRAYSVLSNPRKRREYDHIRKRHFREKFNYREFLRQQESDPASQSKLIFHDLLYNHEEEALFLFEEFVYHRNFALEDYMDREDFMDCAFLLAEEYEKKNEFIKAFELLKKITLFESEKPYFRHFMQEVADRFKHITCVKMPKTVHPTEQVHYLNEVINLNLSKKITEHLTKKLNQLSMKLGKT